MKLASSVLMILLVSAPSVWAQMSDECFIDPRAQISSIQDEIMREIGWRGYSAPFVWQQDLGRVIVAQQDGNLGMTIVGHYRGDQVVYNDNDMDGRIDEVSFQGSNRTVTFEAESDACGILEEVMDHYALPGRK